MLMIRHQSWTPMPYSSRTKRGVRLSKQLLSALALYNEAVRALLDNAQPTRRIFRAQLRTGID